MKPLAALGAWDETSWSIPPRHTDQQRRKFELYGVQQLAMARGCTWISSIPRQRVAMYVGTYFGVWKV
jgi:hypothetical protein